MGPAWRVGDGLGMAGCILVFYFLFIRLLLAGLRLKGTPLPLRYLPAFGGDTRYLVGRKLGFKGGFLTTLFRQREGHGLLLVFGIREAKGI
ncbi:hypothetical protein QBC40DRAFT_42312 [Triangularia verruculosa]|uniref:Uncharacterized protein n=1 Tax=Triangularia verruculosa TaxID=2587418 RepID=A0AAN7AXU5_9PEZI|nr:hypothetical protein QBC40DRAFT_42312 [Triangularia verruculosa]